MAHIGLKQLDPILTGSLQVSGSSGLTGSLNVQSAILDVEPSSSTGITTNNITNGYPTSNPWKTSLDGSYFNNFDNTTHVSEILRFIAGAMSHSLDVADASPNTKYWASVDTNETSLGGTATIAGYLPLEHASLSNDTIDYLVHRGWSGQGRTIFSGISVYHDNGGTYKIDFDSNSGGSTTIQSSADAELFSFGTLTSGAATAYSVRVIASQSFSDTGSVATPTAASNTFTTQSSHDYTVSSFGTTDGLTLAKIATAQPPVIPAAYQDGKFVDVGGSDMSGSLSRKYHASKGLFTSVSSSGYYSFHDLKVGIKSGSQSDFIFNDGTTKTRFWAPRDAINTAIGLNSLADVGTTHKALTATSRSLSGAPYLLDTTYEVTTKITGLFNPLYASSTTLTDMSAGSVTGTATISNDTTSTNGGTIQTSGRVFESDGTTAVNSGVPRYDDVVILSASVSYDSGTSDTIQASRTLTDTSFTVATKARNRESSQTTLDTQTISYHTAGTFGQHADSGSLGVYGRAQGYDSNTLQDTTETFTGEDFRIVLADNVQLFNGAYFTTDSYKTNDDGDAILIGNDLQVKPGFLVDPTGSNGYWFTNHTLAASSAGYRYYIRRFQTDGDTKTSMTVNLSSKTLVAWNATTADSIACAILFESSGKNSGNNAALGRARIYDPTATTSNLIEANISQDHFKNPFSTAIDLYGNTGGGISSGTHTMPIRNGDGMYLDSDDNELYVIVRYKGDPSPISAITLSFS
tara:strand:+ start:19 stop:2262 length:2244 start_codon:yes stop_codon:yes gene_type:complete